MQQEQQTTNGKMPGETNLIPKVKNRMMAIGDILQSVSVRNIVSNVSGLGS
jgi:hypothetical protein